jgi:hypothetical protein
MARSFSASTIAIPNPVAANPPLIVSFAVDPQSPMTPVYGTIGSLGIRTDAPNIYVKTITTGTDNNWTLIQPNSQPFYDTVINTTISTWGDVVVGTLGQNTYANCAVSSSGNTISGLSMGMTGSIPDGIIVTLFQNDASAQQNIQFDNGATVTNGIVFAGGYTPPGPPPIVTEAWYPYQCKTFRYDSRVATPSSPTAGRWIQLTSVAQ